MHLLITIAVTLFVLITLMQLWIALSNLLDILKEKQSYERHERFLTECSFPGRYVSKKEQAKNEAILNEFNEIMKKRHETLDRN
jgi:Mlc titration factor MtfA (ptsG expression regulator)